jgi:hypothetical protein
MRCKNKPATTRKKALWQVRLFLVSQKNQSSTEMRPNIVVFAPFGTLTVISSGFAPLAATVIVTAPTL